MGLGSEYGSTQQTLTTVLTNGALVMEGLQLEHLYLSTLCSIRGGLDSTGVVLW